jgi:phage protein D
VTTSAHQSADTFSASFALSSLPASADANYWSSTAPLPASIEATNDQLSSPWVELISGQVDSVEMDLVDGTLHLSGRDKTAAMIDAKTNEKWINHSAADIVNDIAGRHGLSAVITGAADKAGLTYVEDFNDLTDQDSEWNVLVRLAQREGCIAFVKGSKLYFQPMDQAGATYTLSYVPPSAAGPAQGNFTRLTCTRRLTLAKTVSVKVTTWQQKQKKSVTSEYQSAGTDSALLQYEYRIPNMTKAQADTAAQNRLNENTSHERSIEVDAPGDVSIDPTMTLQLSGTGTAFDQQYLISEIEHRFTMSEGYRMSISVRNKDKKRSSKKVQ